MIKKIYKNILRKLNLSKDELEKLRESLTPDKICKGVFIEQGKMCPTTTALAIRLKKERFASNQEVRKILESKGISIWRLRIFYWFFDVPAFVSKRFFKHSLEEMKRAVDELIKK